MNQPIDIPADSFSLVLSRVWENLVGRVGAPLTFRLILQPTVAGILAFRDGVKDTREGRPAYFWAIIADPVRRWELLRDGWKSIARVFFVALILDVVYQVTVHRWIYPGETLLVGILLAVVPYLLIRGPVNRIARRIRGETGARNRRRDGKG